MLRGGPEVHHDLSNGRAEDAPPERIKEAELRQDNRKPNGMPEGSVGNGERQVLGQR